MRASTTDNTRSRRGVKAPSWFTGQRFAPLKLAIADNPHESAGRHAWLTALGQCWALAHWSDEDWALAADALDEPYPPPDGSPPTFGPGNDFVPPPVVTFERPTMGEAWFDRFGPTVLLRISLTAPDETIWEGIEGELKLARRRFPSKIKRPGRSASNSSFTRQTFRRWWDARIVQVAELDWWNRHQPKSEQQPAAQLARWIFAEAVQAGSETKQMIGARRVLRRALDLRDELASQLAEPSS